MGDLFTSKTKTRTGVFNPFSILPGESEFVRNRLFSDARLGMDPAFREFDFGRATSRVPVELLQRTMGGAFLDPTQHPAFQRLAETRLNLARDLFGDLSGDINSRAALSGIYGSSARLNQLNEAARRVSGEAAADIAGRGFQQFGAERGFQQQAGLAEEDARERARMFGEQQEFQRAMAQLQSYLQQRGLDNATIDRLLRYLAIASGQTEGGQTSETPSPFDMATRIGGILGGLFG